VPPLPSSIIIGRFVTFACALPFALVIALLSCLFNKKDAAPEECGFAPRTFLSGAAPDFSASDFLPTAGSVAD
jgi:hypothetical protein